MRHPSGTKPVRSGRRPLSRAIAHHRRTFRPSANQANAESLGRAIGRVTALPDQIFASTRHFLGPANAILRAQGRPVLALGRSRPAAGVSFLPFELREGVVDINALRQLGIDVIVHAVYDFSVTAPTLVHEVNVEGTARLLDAADKAGIGRFIEISTMSAFDGCSSVYGQAKLAIERFVADRRGLSLRPGLIWGPRPGGMVGTLYKLAGSVPVIPLVGSGNALQYLVRDADVAELIVRLAEYPQLPPVPYLTVCHEQPLQ